MQDFGIAKIMLAIISLIGSGVIVLAVYFFFSGSPREQEDLAFLGLSLGIGASGFVIIAITQIWLAQIATAENTRKILEIMRGQAQSASPEIKGPQPIAEKTGFFSSFIKFFFT